jgi:hypothetical protein
LTAYRIPRLTRPLRVDANWQKPPWTDIPPLAIDRYTGARPSYFPRVQAKLAYDDSALYVIFHVEDRYVRAVMQNYQDPVADDSCVELFFTPGEDITQGYFNLEVNCGGTAWFHHQKARHIADVPVSAADFERVQIAHTLPKVVEPEIVEPVTWTVEYRLPFEILPRYAPCSSPETGRHWRANLHKCADATSHPHWLSWSPANLSEPDFHRPEFFGTLVFA